MPPSIELNGITSTEGLLTNPDVIDYVYRSLLGRAPEPSVLGVKANIIDFIINVANSDERNCHVKDLLRENCIYDLVKTDDGHMVIDSRDKVIGYALKNYKRFTEKDIDKTIYLLDTSGVGINKSLFLDIGANIGTHTIHALQFGFQRALCIEPDCENYKILLINQILNNLSDRCDNICAAVSNRDGVSTLEKSPLNFGDRRVKMNMNYGNDIHDEGNWNNEEIRTQKLDTIFNDLQIGDVGIAWIDTQGHEGHVLEGATKLMLSSAPIVIEFWPYGLSRSGGWTILRELLKNSTRSIYELKNSIAANSLHALSIDELEHLYDEFLKKEMKELSPHTDILLI